MQFWHAIEATDNGEDPLWYVVISADETVGVEEYEGTAAQYGRDVLQNWIDDGNTTGDVLDEYGNPLWQVVVHFGDDKERCPVTRVAVIGADELAQPAPEIAAVEAARDAKLRARHLDMVADGLLEDALSAARAAGHGANELARRAAPAVSRPVALRMMNS
ncbi:hypothetical protein ACIP93_33360 [Streptomyces sp. NPDC088745]|uniref:hypothetical protein n=1 Tax=Streptomyces sp. NPDC088745 TaxID=3365884 RepID=UPI0038299791